MEILTTVSSRSKTCNGHKKLNNFKSGIHFPLFLCLLNTCMIVYSIYKITNQINNKSYIGFTKQKNPYTRINSHFHNKSDPSKIKNIHKAISKYGKESFTKQVLYQSKDKTHTLEMETHFISMYDSRNNGYNMTDGGDSGGYTHTNKTKEFLSEVHKNKKLSQKHIDSIIAAQTGIPKSKDHIKNISKAHKGKSLSNEHRNSISKTLEIYHYTITFKSGNSICCSNLNKFCKENNYDQSAAWKVSTGKQKTTKDIISIDKSIKL